VRVAKLTASQKRALSAGVGVAAALGAAVAVVRSPGLRTSFHAAYVAFRDPSRVRGADGDPDRDPRAVLPTEIDQPELSSDFGKVAEADFEDAGVGALASLTLPALPVPISPRTLRFVNFFSQSEKGREAFAQRFRRAGRYRAHVEQALRDAEMPEDLLWLVAIVSGFEPQATSPKGATGLFQFMPETAARYGLAMNEEVDERRSITRATAAAVQHLRELYDHFGQWDLALAAYNLGQDKVDEAVAKLKERRGPKKANDPLELKDLVEARLIPKETANFVPQLQAFAIVAANRGRFGLDDLDVAPRLDLGEIAVPPGTPLALVARAAGVSVSVLRDYNPHLLRDRAPQGSSDVLVSVPADRVSAALAAFPSLLARERDKLAAASASAPLPEAAPSASASASASAPAKPAEPPSDSFTLPSGIAVERRAASGPDVVIAARVEVTKGGRVFTVDPISVHPGDLAGGLGRAAQAVRRLATDGGEAAVLARKRAGAARRETLEKAPYGASWLALRERLFPAQSPLAGTVLIAPTLPFTSVAIAEPPPPSSALLKIGLTLTGPVERGALPDPIERAFAGALDDAASPSPPAHEERVSLSASVPSARILFGWLVPSATDDERAALRLAILALSHNEVGIAARALVSEKRVAAHVRGYLDVGPRASVAAIEVVPAVMHDVADVEREMDAALEGLGSRGPSAAELTAVKAQLRARLQAEEARAGSTREPRDVAKARLARIGERAEAVRAEDLAALVKKGFSSAHRVVVITSPRG
jgi:hypothetical protein